MPPARRAGRSDRGSRHRPGLRSGPAPGAGLGARAGHLGEAREPTRGHPASGGRAGELPVAIGIVSIPRRDTPGLHPSVPSRYSRPPAAPPMLTGRTEPGVGYRVESSEGNAAAAGIRAGGRHPDDRRVARAGQQPDHGLHRPQPI